MATFLKCSYLRCVALKARKAFVSKSLLQCRHPSRYSINSSEIIRYLHTSPVRAKIIPFYLSDIGEGIREVNVKEWFIKVGDQVKQFDNICEVQSDKASVTITSRFDGTVTKLHHKIDAVALVGQPLIDIDVEDESDQGSAKKGDQEKKSDQESSSSSSSDSSDDDEPAKSKVLATPAVRRIAMQNKLDLSTIPATGRGGRVLKEDLLNFLNISSEDSNSVDKMREARPKAAASPVVSKRPEAPVVAGEDKTVPVSGFTKAMVKTMTAALKIPHFVYSDEVDVTRLVAVRDQVKEAAAKVDVKLTFMPFFIKAASLALTKYPLINSSLDENCEKLTYKAAHNIGVAMDTPNGLAVPNIKNVQFKNIIEIAAELNRIQKDGSKGTFKPDDLMGGTFSLSNIGIIGGTYTKPVILSPQVSIGAIGKIQILPRFDESENITKAHIMCVSWSADHRIIDGVTMASFSNQWKFYVENPNHLMLEI